MKDILSKISKAVDAFTDVLTENVESTNKAEIYRYADFKHYFFAKQKENPKIKKATISIDKVSEFGNIVFSEKKYLIRIVLLNADKEPIIFEQNPDEYVGTIIVASSIDKELADFMGEKTERTVGKR